MFSGNNFYEVVVLMNENEKNMQYIEVSEGIRLHFYYETDFITNFVSLVWTVSADKKTATTVSLIAECLKTGPDGNRTELDKRLADMYGANFDAQIIQKGGRQLIALNFESISDKAADEKVLKNGIELLRQCVECRINEKMLNQAKQRLKNRLEQKNDSAAETAIERLIDIVYADDSFSVHCDGYAEDISNISVNDVNELFGKIKAEAPTDIFISGDINKETAVNYAEQLIYKRRNPQKLEADDVNITAGCAEKSEGRSIDQSRIAMAYTSDLEPYGKDYYTALVLREILCGSGDSVLYDSVRQKEGLCYYIGGRLMRFRMVYIIDAGIKVGSEEKAASIIEDSIRSTKITDTMVNKAKNAVIRAEGETADKRTGRLNETMNSMLLGVIEKIPVEKMIESISTNDVSKALNKLEYKGKFILYAQKGDK